MSLPGKQTEIYVQPARREREIQVEPMPEKAPEKAPEKEPEKVPA